MLLRVSGWCDPSFFSLASMTCTSSFSASSHLPWFRYVHARLAMLLKVSGWFDPNFSLLASVTCTCSFSASAHLPWFPYVDARFAVLERVCNGSLVPHFRSYDIYVDTYAIHMLRIHGRHHMLP